MHHLHHVFIKINIYAIIKMSFINSLSSSGSGTVGPRGYTGERGLSGIRGNDGSDGIRGEDGIRGNDGSDGIRGNDGAAGPRGNDGNNGSNGAAGPRGYTGPQGTNAGPNPTFDSVDVSGTVSCGNSLRMRGFRTLRTNGIQLNYFERDIDEIGRKFTGIDVLSALSNDHSSGVFAVSNNSNSVGGHIYDPSVQGDYSDANNRVALRYVNGTLMATKYNTPNYQRYTVSFFGYH